jgi:acyl-CoA hydrolase
MDLFTMVRPEHLNHYGNLFGGQLLKWVDEYAYLAATREFPGVRLVTRAMDNVSFARGVEAGSTLRFRVSRNQVGTTSVKYAVTVFAQESGRLDEYAVFSTHITFVCIGARHEKQPLPAPLDRRGPGLPPA